LTGRHLMLHWKMALKQEAGVWKAESLKMELSLKNIESKNSPRQGISNALEEM